MDILATQIPPAWFAALWLASLGLLAYIFRAAFWRMLADPTNLNVFLGACVSVLGIWLLKAGIKPGLSFHLLGATVLTLMFRPLFALLGLALIAAGLTAWSGQFAAFSVNWLLLGAVPVAVTWGIHKLAHRWLPRHLFVYFFLNAFVAAGISMSVVGLVSASFHYGAGLYPGAYLLQEYLPFYLLMAWSEAFLSGMLVTVMVVWKPEWVATFSDSVYLHKRDPPL